MKNQKFDGIEQASQSKAIKSTPIKVNYTKLTLAMLAGIVTIAGGIVLFSTINKEVSEWKNAWDQVKFAKENPEIVEVVRQQYYSEYNALRESMIKRQAIDLKAESPKE